MSLKLFQILRRNIRPWVELTSKAPKKKGKDKAKAKEEPISDDIVNIFKDKSDPIILPSEYYPDWLFDNVVSINEVILIKMYLSLLI